MEMIPVQPSIIHCDDGPSQSRCIITPMASSVDDRLKSLLGEGQAIRGVDDHNHPAFKTWRKRVQAALDDKLGANGRLPQEFAELKFFYYRGFWTDGMPPITAEQHSRAFNKALDDALALLTAATEAEPRPSKEAATPLVHIEQVGNTTTSSAEASADVHVLVTVQQLRQLVASEPGLSPEQRADAIASLPDDPEDLTIEKVDKLLDVATKAKGLFAPLLGWLITHVEKINWPG